MMSTSAAAGSALSRLIMSTTPLEWPWAVSTMMTSTLCSTSAMALSHESPKKPTAAPTRSLPCSSLAALGYLSALTKSLSVMRPWSRPSASTMGSFSTLCRARSPSASSPETPTGAVTSGMRVMTSPTGREGSSSKRMSRLVMMPTRVPSASTTGVPEMR